LRGNLGSRTAGTAGGHSTEEWLPLLRYVTAVSRSQDKLDVFVIGTDNRVYTVAWEPGFTDRWPIGYFARGCRLWKVDLLANEDLRNRLPAQDRVYQEALGLVGPYGPPLDQGLRRVPTTSLYSGFDGSRT